MIVYRAVIRESTVYYHRVIISQGMINLRHRILHIRRRAVHGNSKVVAEELGNGMVVAEQPACGPAHPPLPAIFNCPTTLWLSVFALIIDTSGWESPPSYCSQHMAELALWWLGSSRINKAYRSRNNKIPSRWNHYFTVLFLKKCMINRF